MTQPLLASHSSCILALLLAVSIPACNQDPPTTELAAPSASSPPDRIVLGELPTGRETAFGLKLPRQVKIVTREPFRIHAEGRIQPERVANYIRLNVNAEAIDVGAAKTIFNQAVVKGTTEPKLRIEVAKSGKGTRLTLHNLTPQKVDPSLKKEDIQKLHGYDQTGQIVDPKHFE